MLTSPLELILLGSFLGMNGKRMVGVMIDH